MNRLRVCLLFFAFTAIAARAEQANAPAPVTVTSNAGLTSVTSNALPTSITIDGTTYEEVRWQRVTPSTVTIFHKTGVVSIPLEKLPPELQKRFGYDPQKALDYRKQETGAQATIAEQQRAKYLAHSQAVKEKAAHQAVLDSIMAGEINVEGDVLQVLPNGAVIQGAFIETTHRERVGYVPDAGGVFPTVERKERHSVGNSGAIFVIGPPSSFVNRRWSATVYPCGTYQWQGNSLTRYALSPEDALAYTLGNY
jgi:hypothetical protein